MEVAGSDVDRQRSNTGLGIDRPLFALLENASRPPAVACIETILYKNSVWLRNSSAPI